MALVYCPECNKEISDTAKNCPGCGFVMVKSESPKIRRSELSDVKKNPTVGIVSFIIGIICILLGIPLITVVIGIFIIIAGFIFIGIGTNKLNGTQKGVCPYCNNVIEIRAKATTLKCSHCKKISTRNGNFIETIV